MGKIYCGACCRFLGHASGAEVELKCPACKALTRVVEGKVLVRQPHRKHPGGGVTITTNVTLDDPTPRE